MVDGSGQCKGKSCDVCIKFHYPRCLNVSEMDLNPETKCRSRSITVYGSRQGAS